jgi:hypothetical protein
MKDSDASTGASFDVHGLVGIEVDSGTPGGSELHDVLAPFRGGSRSPLKLRFCGTVTPIPEQSHADGHRFTEDSLYLPAHEVQIVANRHGYVIQGRGELLSALIPLLDSLCIRANVAMIHAAAVEYRGSGVLLPASGALEPGTVTRLAAQPGVRFMADDWSFLDADGMLLGYAKPMPHGPPEKPRHAGGLKLLPQPPAPEWLAKSAAKLAASAQPMLGRYPAGRAFARSLSPRTVAPEQIFGPGRISSAALTRLAIFLERFDGRDARLEPRSAEWMTSRVVGNFHAGLPAASRRLIEALGATGLVPLEDHFGQKAAVARRALSEVPCFLLRVPAYWPAGRTSEYVAGLVNSKLEE